MYNLYNSDTMVNTIFVYVSDSNVFLSYLSW